MNIPIRNVLVVVLLCTLTPSLALAQQPTAAPALVISKGGRRPAPELQSTLSPALTAGISVYALTVAVGGASLVAQMAPFLANSWVRGPAIAITALGVLWGAVPVLGPATVAAVNFALLSDTPVLPRSRTETTEIAMAAAVHSTLAVAQAVALSVVLCDALSPARRSSSRVSVTPTPSGLGLTGSF